jgi:hypothetical protein
MINRKVSPPPQETSEELRRWRQSLQEVVTDSQPELLCTGAARPILARRSPPPAWWTQPLPRVLIFFIKKNPPPPPTRPSPPPHPRLASVALWHHAACRSEFPVGSCQDHHPVVMKNTPKLRDLCRPMLWPSVTDRIPVGRRRLDECRGRCQLPMSNVLPCGYLLGSYLGGLCARIKANF